MADLVRCDRRRGDRPTVVHRLREEEGVLPRVVVVRERTACSPLDRDGMQLVPVENLARHLGAAEPVQHRDLQLPPDRLLQPALDEKAEDERRDEEQEVDAEAVHCLDSG